MLFVIRPILADSVPEHSGAFLKSAASTPDMIQVVWTPSVEDALKFSTMGDLAQFCIDRKFPPVTAQRVVPETFAFVGDPEVVS